jgi:TonB family protein
MTKCSLAIVSLILAIGVRAQQITLYFNFDSYNVSKEHSLEIEKFLRANTKGEFVLEAYTDSLGSLVYNQNLSDKRAGAILKQVQGVSPNCVIKTLSNGETQSFDPVQRKNRKVVLRVKEKVNAVAPVLKAPQVFLISNSADTVLECAEGTKIKIPKGSFAVSQDTGTTIELRVTEYYKLNDILKARLTTTSNDRTLATGGMLYVEAFVNGKKCKLAQGKYLGLGFKGIGEGDGMQVFNGEENHGEVNWIAQDNSIPGDVFAGESTVFGKGEVFLLVENMPEFPGGKVGLKQYFTENLKYPLVAMQAEAQGKVYISFVIENDGSVNNVKIVRGIYPVLDYEAYRVVAAMPKWKPGTQRGENVRVAYTLPIEFNLGMDYTIDSTNQVFTREELADIMDTVYNTVAPVTLKEREQMADYYLWTAKMDWINCDKYIGCGGANLFVGVESEYETVTAIFNNEKTIASAVFFDEKAMNRSFRGLPKHQDIILVGVRHTAEGVYLGLIKTKASNQPITIDYHKVEGLDFRELLEGELKN